MAESQKSPKKSRKTGKALPKISRKPEKAKKAVERGKKKLWKTGQGPPIAGPLKCVPWEKPCSLLPGYQVYVASLSKKPSIIL